MVPSRLPLPLGLGAGLGIPGVIIFLVISVLLGGNPLGGGGGGFSVDKPFQQFPSANQGPAGGAIPRASDPNASTVDFVSAVLDDVQASWDQVQASGKQYTHAKLVLYTDAINSGCGQASSATGPFYCPADQKVYLDIAFFQELSQRFGAPATSPRRTSSHMNSGTASRTSRGSARRSRRNSSRTPTRRTSYRCA